MTPAQLHSLTPGSDSASHRITASSGEKHMSCTTADSNTTHVRESAEEYLIAWRVKP